ncbi:MAG TPA: formate dehydrogenase subunit alpha [Acidobacteriota bacterium]|nr:formate dehydrogenase subunit alpha [Acidobacteriota bacterium]HNT17884.1 formate dehydrogenase subunit alpha [Acidobacteriota bacterium]HPA27551.1 formate dehydrogenase subunit alpha [Acidobacteriota bacterium]HQO20375.1 formate dehydrogenase subunit alpha [Acidobacteriota bacterium]HQQ47734.1 formate dehydrogenase subunit alpha [Acidobacteriota bacterium]
MNYSNVPSICPYCGCGCSFFLQVLDGELVGILPNKSQEISKGQLCIKGWHANDFITHKERLAKPLVRKNGELVESTWDEALSIIASKLKEHAPDSVATLSSAKVSNEENYLMQKFTRLVLRTNNVDHCARLCHASTVVGLNKSFGSGAMTNSIPELENCKCMFVIGSNTTEQHPMIAHYMMMAKEKGAKLILADPRSIPWSHFSDIHMRQRPGTDVALLNGMMNVIISEGIEDKKFIEERTEDYDALKEMVGKYPPDQVEKITGIPKEQIIEAARMYAKSEVAAIFYSMGITQHTTGVDNVVSCANLAMITGNIGKVGAGVNALRGQNNVQGSCDCGALPNVYSGYQAVTDEANRKKFEDAWHTTGLPANPGLTVTEILGSAAKGGIKALYIMGENPMVSDPDIKHVKESLEKLDFLAVQDIFLTETARLAHVVLPAVTFAEKDGTYTTTDRRVQLARKAIEPIGESKPDWEIISLLAKKMGSNEFNYGSPADIMDEMARITPIYGGISYDRLKVNGLQWPCPTKEHPGTPILHKEKFSRGKGKFWAIEFKEPAELPDAEYPFILTTGRTIFHYHTGTMSRRVDILNKEVPTGYLEINPADAARLGISEGSKVVVSTRRGEIEIDAKVTERVKEGVVFVPFHFAECAANMLTNTAIDPQAKIPEFKACACKVVKANSGSCCQ